MKAKKKAVLGVLFVVLASACYGITPILSNAVIKGGFPRGFVLGLFEENSRIALVLAEDPSRAVPNELLVGFCMLFACVMSLLGCVFSKKRLAVTKKQLFSLSFLGGAALSLTLLLITYAYLSIPAGMTIVLNFTYPAFVLLAGLIFFRERADASLLASLALATVGVALISSSGFSGSVRALGVVLALASAVSYAVYFLAGRNSSYSSLDPAVTNFYITGSASLIGFAAALLCGRLFIPTDPVILLLLLLEAFLGYVVALRLLLAGIRLLGSAPAAALNTLEPVFAMLTSVLVFGEAMPPVKLVGAALVLLGALLGTISLKSGRRGKRGKCS